MRVLVTLGANFSDAEILGTAVLLAAALEAELHGVFIADADVFRMAALPGAWELSYPKAAERPIQLESLELLYRARAIEVEKRLLEQARAAHVRCSFEVARARRSHWVLSAASEPDVILLTNASEARLFGATPPRRASAPGRPRPVMAVFDGSEPGRRAIAAGRQAAAHLRAPFYLAFAVDRSTHGRDSLLHELREQIGVDTVVDVAGGGVERLAAAAKSRGAALILWGQGDPAEAERLSQLSRCPVALLR